MNRNANGCIQNKFYSQHQLDLNMYKKNLTNMKKLYLMYNISVKGLSGQSCY